MRRLWLGIVLLVLTSAIARTFSDSDEPLRLNSQGEMLFPEHYREWVWLSSGLGMSYATNAREDPDPSFDNVFVSPAAYRKFAATGTWPNGTVFMLEIRASRQQGSINRTGHYQGAVQGLEAHVKKLDGTWAFYGFDDGKKVSSAIPRDASCYSCHQTHGAVDTTFVQFYPTLLPVAREKKTLSEKELLDNSK